MEKQIIKSDILKEEYSDMSNASAVNWQEIGETQEEYAIVDRAGRVQIPRDLLDKLELPGNKVKVSMQEEKIQLERP